MKSRVGARSDRSGVVNVQSVHCRCQQHGASTAEGIMANAKLGSVGGSSSTLLASPQARRSFRARPLKHSRDRRGLARLFTAPTVSRFLPRRMDAG